ncbi:hypothetical protein ACQCN2_06360 [Brevibacillus ginsengisoli]|uniref:hypothetical protein n=1 Tax=Brevibacillus ginsengisoli TaxID=363854 RepID=UPI003CF6B1AB
MKCPWCDQPISQTDTFCPSCDNALIDFEKELPESSDQPSGLQDVIVKKLDCPYCQQEMLFLGEQELQRSSAFSNLFLGELGDLIKGTLRLNMYVCKTCGKAEFTVTDDTLRRIQEFGQLD